MACDQTEIWLEAEQRLAVVMAKIRELDAERVYLQRIIGTIVPKLPICEEKPEGDA